jgi:hypothetical protein
MDLITTVAQTRAEVAEGVARNMAVHIIQVISSLTEGKGTANNEKLEQRFTSLRQRLFLKYAMIDYEVLLSRNARNDMYADLMEGGGL